MAATHIGVGLALGWLIAEIAPAIDDLLGRTTAYAQLQAPAGDEVGSARILGHIEGVLVAHVDDCGPNFDMVGSGAYGREKRKGGGELAGEMMHAEIGAVRAQRLGRDGEVD